MTEAERQMILVLNVAINDLTEEIRGLRSDLQQWSQPMIVSGDSFSVCSHRFITSQFGTVRCANCGLDLGSTDTAQAGGSQ